MLQLTVSSDSSNALEAALAELHTVIDGPLHAAQHSMNGSGPRWSFRDFVSRVGDGANAGGHPGAAALPRPDAQQRAAFEGRLFGGATGTTQLLPPRHRAQPPPLTWDLFQDNGQVSMQICCILICGTLPAQRQSVSCSAAFAICVWISSCWAF